MSYKIKIPKILPPYDDMVFKSMLTRPDAEPARVDLLSVLLGRTIKTATVRNTEMPGRDIDVKQERFDMNCTFDDGDQAAVEMQAAPMRGDSADNQHRNIRDRAAFGLCDLHANQSGSGVDYADFIKSYHVTITNYRVYSEERRLVETFKLRNESGIVLTESVACVFLDLTLVDGMLAVKKTAAKMSGVEMWAVFFAKADDPKCSDIIKQIIKEREAIKVADTMLRDISQDEYERARFHSRKMALHDAEHNRAVALKEGRVEQGKETAYEMFIDGKNIEEIKRYSKLPDKSLAEVLSGLPTEIQARYSL